MPTVAEARTEQPCFLPLFPDWEGRRPVVWYFAEEFLEARAGSGFPTNAAGPDEDVNVYIIGLLTRWADRAGLAEIAPGADPLLFPPTGDRRAHRAAAYRRQADHRLLALGLFDRGDLVRRRKVGWRMTETETRQRDLTVMVRGYAGAASLLQGRREARALVAVWRRLADHGPDYVQALQTLARRRLGLGARLSDAHLARLMAASG